MDRMDQDTYEIPPDWRDEHPKSHRFWCEKVRGTWGPDSEMRGLVGFRSLPMIFLCFWGEVKPMRNSTSMFKPSSSWWGFAKKKDGDFKNWDEDDSGGGTSVGETFAMLTSIRCCLLPHMKVVIPNMSSFQGAIPCTMSSWVILHCFTEIYFFFVFSTPSGNQKWQ